MRRLGNAARGIKIGDGRGTAVDGSTAAHRHKSLRFNVQCLKLS